MILLKEWCRDWQNEAHYIHEAAILLVSKTIKKSETVFVGGLVEAMTNLIDTQIKH